ncbi:AzlC family ABC transporter permease [Bacillus salitolerans]|uniref:AzlC family ABC transporter permease n=1 Tax=Bacillus salitolerans TaxID=1437434 RepID=A0ABW4LXU6_9BACI
MQKKQHWKKGFLDALPIGLSLLVFGAIFGLMSIQADLSAWQSMAMSLIVFAGSAQFATLSMLTDGVNFWMIVLTTFLINSRHFLMGLSMSPYYKGFSTTYTNVMAFFLIDEQYAIKLNHFRNHLPNKYYIIAVSLTLYLTWFIGTSIGTVAGSWIPDPEKLGLGFSFTAMFLALVYFQLTSLKKVIVFIVCGGLAILLTLLLPNGLNLLITGIVAFLIGFVSKEDKEQPREALAITEEKGA